MINSSLTAYSVTYKELGTVKIKTVEAEKFIIVDNTLIFEYRGKNVQAFNKNSWINVESR